MTCYFRVMGSIVSRGTRTKPRYYLQFRIGTKPDGAPKLVMRVARGAQNVSDARKELARIETAIARGDEWESGSKLVVRDVPTLLREWSDSLRNRSAKADRDVIVRDIVPAFKGINLDQLTVGVLMRWLDAMATTDLGGQSQLHRFNYMSRFCTWCVERELMAANPCRSVPRGKRPKVTRDPNVPWLEDDALVPTIMERLEAASYGLGLMFYVARFSGLREGEVAGLRMSDLGWLQDGVIRVRYSYAGPLKEDRANTGKSKMVPAPTDAVDVLRLHLKRRQLQGAKGEDLVFVYDRQSKRRKGEWVTWSGYHPHTIQQEFRAVADALGLHDLDWYRATRHSFITKALIAGASLDEVSAAVGHSSPVVTKKFYDHLVRKSYSSVLRQGLAK